MINDKKPTTDFNAVRDGRRSPWYSYELDLSVARIDAPSQDFILPIAGNSFYVDRAPDVGSAFIQFQDTSFDRAMLPIYAGPGFIANAPFTQIKITNAAQPGKTLRIFYGVDIDFLPGTSSEIVLSGAVSISSGTVSISNSISTKAKSLANFVAVNNESTAPSAGYSTWIAPASNTAGVTILNASIRFFDTSNIIQYFIASAAQPVFIGGSPVILMSQVTAVSSTGNIFSGAELNSPVFLPVGIGLYFYSSVGSVNNCARTVTYINGTL